MRNKDPLFVYIRNLFIYILERYKFYRDNDPVKKCSLYRNEGCAHVDGILCDFPDCTMYKDYEETLDKNKIK